MFKKITIFVCIFLISSAFMLAKTEKEVKQDQINSAVKKSQSMSRQDFIDKYKKSHKRIPDKANRSKANSNKSKAIKKNQNPRVQSLNNQVLPAMMTFPGEFEEVKAVMVTWPYLTYDENQQDAGEPEFKGIGAVYNNQTGQYDIYPVISIIDTFAVSPMPEVFSKLIHAIDSNAEVWINVWEDADTAVVQRYMASKSWPLQHAKFFVNSGNSFWYRDCGPVGFYYSQLDSLGFIDFEYYTGRPLDDSIPIYIGNKLGIPVFTNSVCFEGGNILLDGVGNLFTSTAVTIENQNNFGQDTLGSDGKVYPTDRNPLTTQQLKDNLTNILNLNSLKILPMLQFDGGTGHIDLYADLFDPNNFVFAQYPDAMKTFTDYKTVSKNVDTISSIIRTDGDKYLKHFIPLPKKDDGSWYKTSADYQKYTRSYSNHLILNKSIIQPVFADDKTGDYQSMLTDLDSIRSAYPGYNIIPIDIRAFDGFGGAIHCITKQIPADNPIRILDFPLKSTQKGNTQYLINATIKNKSGIKSAVAKWRYKGESTWRDLILLNIMYDKTYFTGVLKNDSASGVIEYYISATSWNGKTITKPMTAPLGFNSFTFNNYSDVNDANSFSSEYSFYPNPASTLINIKGDLNICKIEIYSLLGEMVKSGLNIGTIDITDLPDGMYFISINNKRFKFIKE
ncbi:MAG: agmatine deiminase family protein [Candidatus Kapabacteria bacterium]|nr:agmatine deiminase family protein [Candidatus Kapabacteria bacterium]